MLLSSHVLEEVAATCDRVVVVARGRGWRRARSTSCWRSGSGCARPRRRGFSTRCGNGDSTASEDGPGTVIVAGADPDAVGRAVRDSGAVLHEMSTQGALEALYVGLTDEH